MNILKQILADTKGKRILSTDDINEICNKYKIPINSPVFWSILSKRKIDNDDYVKEIIKNFIEYCPLEKDNNSEDIIKIVKRIRFYSKEIKIFAAIRIISRIVKGRRLQLRGLRKDIDNVISYVIKKMRLEKYSAVIFVSCRLLKEE